MLVSMSRPYIQPYIRDDYRAIVTCPVISHLESRFVCFFMTLFLHLISRRHTSARVSRALTGSHVIQVHSHLHIISVDKLQWPHHTTTQLRMIVCCTVRGNRVGVCWRWYVCRFSNYFYTSLIILTGYSWCETSALLLKWNYSRSACR